MNHDDFNTLDVELVVSKLLAFCQTKSNSKAVHWLSTFGLTRIQASTSETWHWAFSTPDLAGKHVVSVPHTDPWDLFHIWRKVAGLYAQPWMGPYDSHLITAAPENYVAIPVLHADVLFGVILLEAPTETNPVKLTGLLKEHIQLASKYVSFAYSLLDARNMSYVDELTGLHNQRYLPTVLEHEIERSKRDNAQFSLLFLDIDYFKMVNDGRGHWVGSKLLVELGTLLRGQVRSCDYTFRYGGDEFIILLGSSNAENSKTVAERIRKTVESHSFEIEGHNLNLTVSIGLAAYPEHAQSASALIQLADQAMYYGKRKSRNIVFVAS